MASTRSAEAPDDKQQRAAGPRIIKKYPNRRLYDTQSSSYVTLVDVKRMVLDNQSFEVRDARTGEDITRSILMQIILEEETGGVPMFSTPMLAQIIRFYGHAMQGVMGAYLEKNIQTFIELQHRLAENPAQTPELWAQYLNSQVPMMQGIIGSYLEQSRDLFLQMREQMLNSSATLFPGSKK